MVKNRPKFPNGYAKKDKEVKEEEITNEELESPVLN